MKPIEIVRQKYFPVRVRTIGVFILLFTITQLIKGNIEGTAIFIHLLFNALALAFWIVKEIVQIDLYKKEIGEGFKMFGLTKLKWMKYSAIEKIYVNSINTMSKDVYSLPWTITVRDKFYKAFLKTAEGDKIFLAADTDKDNLLIKLKRLNRDIGTEIFDTSNLQMPVRITEGDQPL